MFIRLTSEVKLSTGPALSSSSSASSSSWSPFVDLVDQLVKKLVKKGLTVNDSLLWMCLTGGLLVKSWKGRKPIITNLLPACQHIYQISALCMEGVTHARKHFSCIHPCICNRSITTPLQSRSICQNESCMLLMVANAKHLVSNSKVTRKSACK